MSSYDPFVGFLTSDGRLPTENDLVWQCPDKFKSEFNIWHMYVMNHSFGSCQMNYWDLKNAWKFKTRDYKKIEKQIRYVSSILNGSNLRIYERINIASWMLSEMLEEVPFW